MKKIFKILYFLVIFVFGGCHKDEPRSSLIWDKTSDEIIINGIRINSEPFTTTLSFTSSNIKDIYVYSEEEWIKTDLCIDDNTGQLTIVVETNNSYEERTGVVKVLSESTVDQIEIHQNGLPMALPDSKSYTVGAEGSELVIGVEANGALEAALYPHNCNWASISNIRKIKEDAWWIIVKIDKNVELGRIASLELKVDGKMIDLNCNPCIIQEPAPFKNDIVIYADKPGMLPILLGNDIENYKRIRNLTVIGGINGIDFPVLKRFFVMDEESVHVQSISMDLSDCAIVAGYFNPYQYFGWQPNNIDESDPVFYGEIPDGIFTNASNLVNIVLPESLKIIGRMAFSGCCNLQKIDIPNTVEEIGAKAFFECNRISKLNLSSNSNLTSIGNQAFTTGSLIDSLSLPECLIYIAGEAFLGCSVKELHLNWTDPFEVKIVPRTDGCTLFVPHGTKELYQSTSNWNKFEHIVEV